MATLTDPSSATNRHLIAVGHGVAMDGGHPRETIVDVARILVLVQGAIAVVSTIEAAFWGFATALLTAPIILLTGGTAALTLWASAGLARRSRRARRVILIIEVVVLVAATIDLLLSLFLAERMLEPVPLLTRFVLPYAVFRMLRRPAVRAEFGVRQSRRTRRREAKAARAVVVPA